MKAIRFSLVAALTLTLNSYALTDAQKRELWDSGTITVRNEDGSIKGHFEVTIAPGADDIEAARHRALKQSHDIIDDLIEKNFWESEVKGKIKAGRNYIREHIDNGILKIDDDFRATREANKESHGKWGHRLSTVSNWLKFGKHVGERLAYSAWGVGAGSIYTIAAPAGKIFMVPVRATTTFVKEAVFSPAKAYAWQGAAWVALQGEDEPKPGDMFVTFVPARCDAAQGPAAVDGQEGEAII